jgi:hypothetical protein
VKIEHKVYQIQRDRAMGKLKIQNYRVRNLPRVIPVQDRNSEGCQRGSATAAPYALRHPTTGK